MSSTWLRKVSRSIRAATIVVFSNKSVQLENGRFVVTMVHQNKNQGTNFFAVSALGGRICLLLLFNIFYVSFYLG